MPSFFTTLPRDTRFLLGARAARSVGQGALIVAFALYLHALGWSAPAIGGLFTLGLLLDAGLTTISGPLSDQFGRRRFLLVYEGLQIGAAIVALATSQPILLGLAAVVGGFGRGANGSSGPFAPVELSWLSQRLKPGARGGVYSVNMAIGFSGMGLGALLGGLPVLFGDLLPGALAYRPLFALSLAGSLSCLILLYCATDHRTATAAEPLDSDRQAQRDENSLLFRLFGSKTSPGYALSLDHIGAAVCFASW